MNREKGHSCCLLFCSSCHAGCPGARSRIQAQLYDVPQRSITNRSEKSDHAAWKPRLGKGTEVLVKHVTEGFDAIPPRGLRMDCSAEDYMAVIAWMSK
ncbi:c-type cytochrome [Pseudomonas fragi]|uniref:c-type cytochrome n=1 Tax=Pseudomonas fragi TaxID=296 RepID=UPI00105461A5|nr:c-type cytochrome [Pseudomonas fragi]